ncbi:MAG: NAD(P)/FAD-dependent oxidoreductase [Candidatus Dormibacteria bacterium]
MKIAIAGGGIAGLSAGIFLARAGHRVDLIESDGAEPPPLAADAFLEWDRRGVAHHRMPHQVLGRLRNVLLANAPDVREALLAAGASEHEAFRKIPGGEWLPEDEPLVMTFVRRPVLEVVLRRAAVDAGVAVHGATRVDGVLLDDGAAVGLDTSEGEVLADLVVDAAGRRTGVAGWLAAHGLEAPVEQRSDCGVVYYCRYYHLQPGSSYPDVPYPTGAPLGDVAGLRFNMMRGDNRTHCVLLGVPAWDREYRELRNEEVFEAVLRGIQPLAAYVADDFAEPITGILAMGDIENVRRHYARDGHPLLPGLVGIGDSYCHTDPLFGWGASFAVAHAAALAGAVAAGGSPAAIGMRLEAAIAPEADEAFTVASLEDDARARDWRGEPLNLDPDIDIAAFVRKVVSPGAAVDPVLFRALMRRVNILDTPGQIYHDREVREHAVATAARMAAAPPRWTPPTREQLGVIIRGVSSGRP